MRVAIDYTDKTREAIIAEQEVLGFRLVEDQRHLDGNHLIFEDGKSLRDPLAEIDELKANYNTLKAKVEKLEKK